MSRFFAFGNVKRVAHVILTNQRTSYLEAKKHGALVTVGLPSPICRLYTWHKFYSRGRASFTAHKAKENMQKTNYSKSFSIISASSTMIDHAQIAWKRLSQKCSYSGPAFSPINRIACAVSLALTRSHLVAPSIFAFVIGEVACTQKAWADTEYFPTGKTLYMHAEKGHVYLTSFVFLVLEGFILLLRSIYLAILFLPTMAMAPFADCFGYQFRKTWLHLVHLTLEKAGPAFIKWGQWAAARPDLFPRDLCTELSKLQTEAPAHSFAYTKRIIEEAFHHKLPEIFEDFEEVPVASGSVAQVHRASLRFQYPGQHVKPILVAVKVRHPGVSDAIRRDFFIINLVAKFSNFIPTLKWLRLDESLQQFAVFMMSQVDLAREAAQLSRFIYNFRSWKDVSFPKPLYPLVHPAVLVETYEHGESVSYYVDELEGNNQIKTALAQIGTHALLKMLLEVEKLFNFWDSTEGGAVHPAECMQQLLEQVRHHKVNIDGNVCMVMVTMLVLEGWQQKLDPDYNVMLTLRTLLFKADWAQSLLYTIEELMAP
ncbi:PREDICTED: ABC1 family protein C21C3.03, mitochondrial-like isoform X2 [Nelumbo nucifera]|uniref:ABC1 family protein C21C3.03, mitochondrial-like isoform X2 n=1 Tax=Nelumbo nucifera TaxID=4432 RepID=A0A1U8AN10_NELNU|nr:PREDICTED: ABC1 family protein C21C3.03, mitochondrial-like isoform X2 [Nelumbo nucifera]